MTEPQNESKVLSEKYTRLRNQARAARFDSSRMFIAQCLSFCIILIGVLDAVSTNAAINAGGVEANPIIRFIMSQIGEFWVTPKLLVHVLLAFMVLWFPNKPTLIMMMCAMIMTVYAVLGNFSIAFS